MCIRDSGEGGRQCRRDHQGGDPTGEDAAADDRVHPPAPAQRQVGGHTAADQGADGHRGAVQPRKGTRDPLLVRDQRDRRGERVHVPAPGDERGVERQGETVPDEPLGAQAKDRGHRSRSTTWSMHAVSACTSAGSTAGNMPTRTWLRPSLRYGSTSTTPLRRSTVQTAAASMEASRSIVPTTWLRAAGSVTKGVAQSRASAQPYRCAEDSAVRAVAQARPPCASIQSTCSASITRVAVSYTH